MERKNNIFRQQNFDIGDDLHTLVEFATVNIETAKRSLNKIQELNSSDKEVVGRAKGISVNLQYCNELMMHIERQVSEMTKILAEKEN